MLAMPRTFGAGPSIGLSAAKKDCADKKGWRVCEGCCPMAFSREQEELAFCAS